MRKTSTPPAPKSSAERASQYRRRRKAEGLVAVKCYLAPDAVAYLGALCKIHDATISEAISMTVARAFRGDAFESSLTVAASSINTEQS